MRKIAVLFFITASFVSCHQKKEYTLAELKRAKWDSLTKGVDYISTDNEKGIASKTDSLVIKIIAVPGKDIIPTELSSGFNSFFIFLNPYLVDSKQGYLKMNLNEVLRNDAMRGAIYLRGEYSPTQTFASDSARLANISGIKEVTFISKEMAKKEFLGDGNSDWERVLDENPLPNSIEIRLENTDWTEEALKSLETAIRDEIGANVSDISFPRTLLIKNDEYYFLEYKRISY